MALGGGTWTAQNKVLPGAYINFLSAARASASLSDRGIATVPLSLDWGPEGQVFTVTAADFQKNSLKILGHAYTDDELKPLREVFANAHTAHVFRLNAGGTKATNTYADANYPGTRGNDLKISIQQNEAFVKSTNEVYDVTTYLGTTEVDVQKGVRQITDLKANDFVTFKQSGTLTVTAATPLASGTDGTVENEAWQTYLDKIESYSFHTMGCPSEEETIKQLFVNFTKRMRDESGVKFQTVVFRYPQADFEGVISVKNGLVGADTDPAAVYWVTGAEAGCAVNKSLTNASYNGEYDINIDYTQTQLEAAIQSGELALHQVNGGVRVLTDINTFVSVTDEKSEDFSSNQTIRVLDQIGNDIAAVFNDKYLGKIPNDNAGRISLWNDIVSHHQQLQAIRAIENFTAEDVTVEAGESKKSVVVNDYVTPTNAMEKLYMQVIVE